VPVDAIPIIRIALKGLVVSEQQIVVKQFAFNVKFERLVEETAEQDEGNCSYPGWPVRKSDWCEGKNLQMLNVSADLIIVLCVIC
jgi:hypothetical protein